MAAAALEAEAGLVRALTESQSRVEAELWSAFGLPPEAGAALAWCPPLIRCGDALGALPRALRSAEEAILAGDGGEGGGEPLSAASLRLSVVQARPYVWPLLICRLITSLFDVFPLLPGLYLSFYACLIL